MGDNIEFWAMLLFNLIVIIFQVLCILTFDFTYCGMTITMMVAYSVYYIIRKKYKDR